MYLQASLLNGQRQKFSKTRLYTQFKNTSKRKSLFYDLSFTVLFEDSTCSMICYLKFGPMIKYVCFAKYLQENKDKLTIGRNYQPVTDKALKFQLLLVRTQVKQQSKSKQTKGINETEKKILEKKHIKNSSILIATEKCKTMRRALGARKNSGDLSRAFSQHCMERGTRRAPDRNLQRGTQSKKPIYKQNMKIIKENKKSSVREK